MAGVAALGLVEDRGDGAGAAGGDLRGVPPVDRLGTFGRGLAGSPAQDLLRGPRLIRRPDVEDRAGLGDPLVAGLPGTQPLAERLGTVPGLAGGLGPAAPGRIATPLPSAEIASGSPAGQAAAGRAG